MQNRDILWAISIPFRIYNTRELDINTLTFTLSFDAAIPNCNVSMARKLISFALEKGWIKKANEKNILVAKFELWQPKLIPLSWKPKFSNLEKVPMINLIPLDSNIEYKPQFPKNIKKPKSTEKSPLFTPKPTEKDKDEKVDKRKEIITEKQSEIDNKIIEKKKKSSIKKKKDKKNKKQKGQKSIQDFFK